MRSLQSHRRYVKIETSEYVLWSFCWSGSDRERVSVGQIYVIIRRLLIWLCSYGSNVRLHSSPAAVFSVFTSLSLSLTHSLSSCFSFSSSSCFPSVSLHNIEVRSLVSICETHCISLIRNTDLVCSDSARLHGNVSLVCIKLHQKKCQK